MVETTKTANIVQYTFIGVTIGVSYIAMWYISRKQKAVAPEIVYERRKRRQVRLQAAQEEDA
jgi:phage major head subunit gpT-like protein